MSTLARFVIRNRWWVIAAWLLFIVLANAASSALGGANYKDEFTLPHTETATVSNLLKSSGQSSQNGIDGIVVFHVESGDVKAPPPGVISALQGLCTPATGVVTIASGWGSINCAAGGVLDPSGASPKLLSTNITPVKDPTIALVDVTFSGNGTLKQSSIDAVYKPLNKLNSSKLEVEFTGDGFQGEDKQAGIPPELLGFIAALIILGFVFRTPGAVALPLASAIVALGTGTGLIGVLTHAMSVSQVTPQLAQLMVIGVGVDYALFIVTRHRRNLLKGMSVEDSIALAINTSGRAVLFAGVTVCIAMLGLIALGVSFFYGLAVGVAVAVSLTMLASLTLLPALLRFLGLYVLPRKQRRAIRAGTYVPSPRTSFWERWSEIVAHRKALLGVAAGVVIVALAIPFFSMRMGHADQGNDPAGSTTRKGYDLITQGFGVGYNSTLTLVVSGPHAQLMAAKVAEGVRDVPDVDPSSIFALPKPLNPTLTIVNIKSTTAPEDVKTTDLVQDLRKNVLPQIYAGTGDHVYVYGQTAVYTDFTHVLSTKMPLFIGAVVLLSFLLLMLAFRSIVVPLTAALMNLFAAGASFGVIVAIFQWGWGAEALGIGKGGPIEAFAPVLFFAILFGLSMDYQVFLVSRMHEEWIHTGDNRRAIRVGQAETGGIITAAAFIMITVFGGFILGDNRVVKLIGIGLASAIFIDAFILRTILVPSVMHLMGKANWWFPKWLDRITPRVSVEPPEEHAISQGDPGDDPRKQLVDV
ncbi:MAG TPA: MMPL family transporter [Jatrophihabitantaceae bacterium]|nr:MMPL family transporter [Jatrophihabitantaceae bacterium]